MRGPDREERFYNARSDQWYTWSKSHTCGQRKHLRERRKDCVVERQYLYPGSRRNVDTAADTSSALSSLPTHLVIIDGTQLLRRLQTRPLPHPPFLSQSLHPSSSKRTIMLVPFLQDTNMTATASDLPAEPQHQEGRPRWRASAAKAMRREQARSGREARSELEREMAQTQDSNRFRESLAREELWTEV